MYIQTDDCKHELAFKLIWMHKISLERIVAAGNNVGFENFCWCKFTGCTLLPITSKIV